MQLDIYLGFTYCGADCLFCHKGEDIIEFTRPAYVRDTSVYQYQFFSAEKDIWIWLETYTDNPSYINISGNEPLNWKHLGRLLNIISERLPKAFKTLRISNTNFLSNDILAQVDCVELSLYGHTKELHESMMGDTCHNSWHILHKNIQHIQQFPQKKGIRLQTIMLHKNKSFIREIVAYMLLLSNGVPPKIVYPHFMPRSEISELIPKREFLNILIRDIPEDLRIQCIIHISVPSSFPPNLFYAIEN